MVNFDLIIYQSILFNKFLSKQKILEATSNPINTPIMFYVLRFNFLAFISTFTYRRLDGHD